MPAISPALKARIVLGADIACCADLKQGGGPRLVVREFCNADEVILSDGPRQFPDLATGAFDELGKVLSSLSGVTEILYAPFGPVDQRHISRDAGALSSRMPVPLSRRMPPVRKIPESPVGRGRLGGH